MKKLERIKEELAPDGILRIPKGKLIKPKGKIVKTHKNMGW